jgi:hypothetical protein
MLVDIHDRISKALAKAMIGGLQVHAAMNGGSGAARSFIGAGEGNRTLAVSLGIGLLPLKYQ